jgi:hypothetical protein
LFLTTTKQTDAYLQPTLIDAKHPPAWTKPTDAYLKLTQAFTKPSTAFLKHPRSALSIPRQDYAHRRDIITTGLPKEIASPVEVVNRPTFSVSNSLHSTVTDFAKFLG